MTNPNALAIKDKLVMRDNVQLDFVRVSASRRSTTGFARTAGLRPTVTVELRRLRCSTTACVCRRTAACG